MNSSGNNTKPNIVSMAEEIFAMSGKIDDMLNRIAVLEEQVASDKKVSQKSKGKSVREGKAPVGQLPEEEGWTKISQEVLLPRIAAVCFMLVVALILRTVTDNGMLNMQVGTYIGTIYAISLIGWGWFLYSKAHKLAPVFPACGVLLLYSIIFETHVHFESLTSSMVYTILLAAEIMVVVIGLRCRALTLLYFAMFGSTMVGVAINFPTPLFTCLGIVLIVNNIAAHLAARRGISAGLRWYSLFFSMAFWLLWTSKLNYAVRFSGGAQELGLFWSMPILLMFFSFYMYTTLWQIKNRGDRMGIFHYVMPTINAVGLFAVSYFILTPWLGNRALVGQAAVVLSALYIAMVAFLARDEKYTFQGAKALVVAASVLMVFGLAVFVPPVWALPVWAVAASALALYSNKWQSGGVRFISYLFHGFVMIYALKSGAYVIGDIHWLAGGGVSAFLAVITLWLYQWARKNQPKYDSFYFKELDREDGSAVVLLMIGLVHSYFFSGFMAYEILLNLFENYENAFSCTKSIVINLGAVILMVAGLKKKAPEILKLAVAVVFIGGFKVFIFDMFRSEGVPLVLSVFSLGIVAVASSMTIKKWQNYKVKLEKSEVREVLA